MVVGAAVASARDSGINLCCFEMRKLLKYLFEHSPVVTRRVSNALRSARPWGLLVLLGVGGCVVGPNFKTPAAPATERYAANELQTTSSIPVHGGEAQSFMPGAPLPQAWWTLFGSEKLNRLVDDAFAGSPSIESAQAALRNARETYLADRSLLWPAFDANAGASRHKDSGAQFGGAPNIYNLYQASVSVSYGVDIFGLSRRLIESQSALVENQYYELQASYLTLAANVVTSAVQEASLRAQILATKDILAAQEKQLRVTERRQELGAVALSSVLSIRSNLAATRATLPPLEKQLDATQNLLAVYQGKLPSERQTTEFDLTELALPQALPLSVPSELVRRRPDIRAAEALLHQASSQVGVATANMYPQISISGQYGVQSRETSGLLDSRFWNIGANVTQPLLHFGQLQHQRRAAIAQFEQAAASYRLVVLQAFQNVADALRALESDAQALQAQYDAAAAAQSSLQLIEKQYGLGGASYLELLTAQNQYQNAQINYLQALAARYQDTAALFQALGGGDQHELAATSSR
jgi:NodT family efflux transporter outer membrane factor (OMF) lipoprotein